MIISCLWYKCCNVTMTPAAPTWDTWDTWQSSWHQHWQHWQHLQHHHSGYHHHNLIFSVCQDDDKWLQYYCSFEGRCIFAIIKYNFLKQILNLVLFTHLLTIVLLEKCIKKSKICLCSFRVQIDVRKNPSTSFLSSKVHFHDICIKSDQWSQDGGGCGQYLSIMVCPVSRGGMMLQDDDHRMWCWAGAGHCTLKLDAHTAWLDPI